MVFFFVFSVIGVCLALSRGGAAPAFLPVASNDAAAGGEWGGRACRFPLVLAGISAFRTAKIHILW